MGFALLVCRWKSVAVPKQVTAGEREHAPPGGSSWGRVLSGRPAARPDHGRRAGLGAGQAVVQVLPLRVKLVGAAVLPVWVAWKPNSTEPPAGMALL